MLSKEEAIEGREKDSTSGCVSGCPLWEGGSLGGEEGVVMPVWWVRSIEEFLRSVGSDS